MGAQCDMTDVQVTFGVETLEEDARLVDALDVFMGLLLTQAGPDEAELPGVVVRSAVNASGRRERLFIFEDRKWAEDFLTFWDERRLQPVAG